jgi:hypothetical protein
MSKRRAIVTIVIIAFATGAWMLWLTVNRCPIPVPWENNAEYAVRRLKSVDNHVEMPKAADSWVQSIVSSGPEGIEVLIKEVASGNGDGTRFTPTPGEILTRFGESGRLALQSEFLILKAKSLLSDEYLVANQAPITFVVASLVKHYSDLSLLSDWLDLAERAQQHFKHVKHRFGVTATRQERMGRHSVLWLNEIVQEKFHEEGCPEIHDELNSEEVRNLKKWVGERLQENSRTNLLLRGGENGKVIKRRAVQTSP